MTRFPLWERPMSYPFFDIVTRDTEPGPVFDLSVDLDGYDGPVYLKPEHVAEMARSLGMADKDTVDAMKYEIDRLNRLVNALPEEARVLEDGLAALVSDFHTRLANRADGVSPVGEPESESEDLDKSVKNDDGSLEISGPIKDDSDGDFLHELESEPEVPETTGQEPSDSSVERPASVRNGSKSKSGRIEL